MGETHYNVKLSDAKIETIKKSFSVNSKGITNAKKLSRKFGVTEGTIRCIGRGWYPRLIRKAEKEIRDAEKKVPNTGKGSIQVNREPVAMGAGDGKKRAATSRR